MRRIVIFSLLTIAGLAGCNVSEEPISRGDDPLPSWNDGAAKESITRFVASVVDPNSATYVEPSERIAVFDNDGTLWAEQPLYFQLLFALDRVRDMAAQHPEWQEQEPFKAVLEGDREKLG